MGVLARILARMRRRPARGAPQPLRAAEVLAFPVGGGRTLVWAAATGRARLVPDPVAALLQSSGTFATVDEHLRRWLEAAGDVPEGSATAFRDALEDLFADGFLVSPDRLLDAARSAAASTASPAGIGVVGLVTCDRPGPLEEAIAGHLAVAGRSARRLEVVVVDDTAAADARRATRERLAALDVPPGVSLRYAGREEKLGFAALLVRETGVPAELVDFALADPERAGRPVGANRNALLLHTVGDLLFSADDDVRPRMAAAPGGGDGLALVSVADPTEFTFFPDRQAALGAVRLAGADPLAEHERLLGAGLAACVSGAVARSGIDALDLSEAGPRLLTHLLRGRGRVLVTLSGLVGDGGLGSADWLLALPGRSRERLVATEASYRSALASREILRLVPRPTVGEVALCMAAAIGLDNREPLPPFFPVRRNQDGVFGLTLRLALDDALTGLLPHALLHAPPEARRFPEGQAWGGAAAFHVADVVMDAMTSLLPLGAPAGAARLAAMGRGLGEIAALPPGEFRMRVDDGRRRRLGRRAGALEELLEAHDGAPAYWARDVRRQLEVIRAAALRDDLDVPVDLADGRTPDEARALTRRLLGRYGALLEAWPALVDGARRLRAQGIRLATPVGGREP